MFKKKILALSSILIGAFTLVLCITIAGNSNLQYSQAIKTPYVLTINKDTVHTDKWWLGSYVYTDNGNTVSMNQVDGTIDEIYSFESSGEGAGVTTSIQAIQSISITYKLPRAGMSSGYFDLTVGDSCPAYSASYYEEFKMLNTSDAKQTQVFNMVNPSQCHFIDLWYASSGEGNALVYEIVITYQCV